MGNLQAAYAAQERVLDLKGAEVRAQDLSAYADMLVVAAGGYVSPEAETALARALERDPRNGVARYYSGLMASQIGRPDIAFRTWAALLRESPPDAPWLPPVRDNIEDMAFRAGVDYTLPPVAEARGPTQDDIQAASEMSEEDRMEMIRGMVNGLSERLATEGGPPEDWARLMSALVVLGEGDRALLIYNDGKRTFADNDAALDVLRATARRVGMPE